MRMKPDHQLACVSLARSLLAFSELAESLVQLRKVQLILPSASESLELLGGEADRAARNHLLARSLARRGYQWLNAKLVIYFIKSAASSGLSLDRKSSLA